MRPRVHFVSGGVITWENRFVFSSDMAGTRPWSPKFVTKRSIGVRHAAALGRFELHDLRHFVITQMFDAAVPVPIVRPDSVTPELRPP